MPLIENKTKKQIQWQKYYRKNRRKLLEKKRKYYAAHSERICEKERQRYERNKKRILAYRKLYRVKAYGNYFDLSVKEWDFVCEVYDHKCAYCGSQQRLQCDHIEPLSKGGAHTIGNVIPACILCNSSKNNHDVYDWMERKGYDWARFCRNYGYMMSEYDSRITEFIRDIDAKGRIK